MSWRKHICIILPLVLLTVLIGGCSDDPSPRLNYTSAIQLRNGNFWIYQATSTDLFSGIKINQLDDSVFVEKDTIIDQAVYFIIKNLFGRKELKREMSGTIVDQRGNIEFSGTNFSDTLYRDPNLGFYGLMEKEEVEITVPAGVFNTVSFVLLRRNSPGHHSDVDSSNPSYYNKEFSVAKRVWYARNIGVVKSVLYFGNVSGFELNLKKYNAR
ncbi:hypothetical protein WBG78_28940 [Chryseolinea sp. T2]|uniref:hypothetical protein n=1 Tax=Chryseolinea sp. T2 TaxID=3129255 RepID=UPI0030789819